MELTYSSYLHLDRLLSLQVPRSSPAEHDEMIFIITHQAYELWFKLQLHELEKIRHDLSAGDVYGAIATFKRVRTIMKVMVEQIDILETLTPLSFNSFRDRLDTASGFQSIQFREFEFLLGYKRPEMLKYYSKDSAALNTLNTRLKQVSVLDAFYEFLATQGVPVPEKPEDPAKPRMGNDQTLNSLVRLYKGRNDLQILFELMTDFDEGFQEWRYRHIKLVERTIGAKKGTGGSLGVEFLKKSLFTPIFPDLWALRHHL